MINMEKKNFVWFFSQDNGLFVFTYSRGEVLDQMDHVHFAVQKVFLDEI